MCINWSMNYLTVCRRTLRRTLAGSWCMGTYSAHPPASCCSQCLWAVDHSWSSCPSLRLVSLAFCGMWYCDHNPALPSIWQSRNCWLSCTEPGTISDNSTRKHGMYWTHIVELHFRTQLRLTHWYGAFPSSCNFWLQQHQPCEPIREQNLNPSAIWLDGTVLALATGCCKNLEKRCIASRHNCTVNPMKMLFEPKRYWYVISDTAIWEWFHTFIVLLLTHSHLGRSCFQWVRVACSCGPVLTTVHVNRASL